MLANIVKTKLMTFVTHFLSHFHYTVQNGVNVKQSVLGIGMAWRYTELSVAKTQILLSTVTNNYKTYKAHPQLHKGPVNKVINKKHSNCLSTG